MVKRCPFNQGTVSLLPPSVPHSWNIRPARSNLVFSRASWPIILLESCFDYRFERIALRFHMNIFQFNVANVSGGLIMSRERYYVTQKCKRKSCHKKENSPQHSAWDRASIQYRTGIFYMLMGHPWYKAECVNVRKEAQNTCSGELHLSSMHPHWSDWEGFPEEMGYGRGHRKLRGFLQGGMWGHGQWRACFRFCQQCIGAHTQAVLYVCSGKYWHIGWPQRISSLLGI